MTQIVLGVNDLLLTPLANAIIAIFKSIFSFVRESAISFSWAVAMSRSMEANRKIAFYLRHEYPKWSEQEIIAHLNEKSVKALRKDFNRG